MAALIRAAASQADAAQRSSRTGAAQNKISAKHPSVSNQGATTDEGPGENGFSHGSAINRETAIKCIGRSVFSHRILVGQYPQSSSTIQNSGGYGVSFVMIGFYSGIRNENR
jgi:hypothetical protein